VNPPQKLTSGALEWDVDVLSVSKELMEWFVTCCPYKQRFPCLPRKKKELKSRTSLFSEVEVSHIKNTDSLNCFSYASLLPCSLALILALLEFEAKISSHCTPKIQSWIYYMKV